MTTQKQTQFSKDAINQRLQVIREFDAPLQQVWEAWTDSNILEQWWAPRPWKAETKIMDFREGGIWLYCMAGPSGERHWCRVAFNRIHPLKSFSVSNGFCDEEGNINGDLPLMEWNTQFSETPSGTTVTVDITFPHEGDMEKIIAMGFQEGFTMAHANLDEWLATQAKVS